SQCVSQHEGQFDAVIGMEVIEHVENPWEYLRLLKRMAKSGGLIVVTTPNVESWASRWNYLLTGRLTHFEDGDYIGSGHINPISSWEFRLSAEALGLVNIRTYETCRLPLIWITRNLRLMIGSFILAPIRFALTGRISGDITLCVARKPADGAPF
ncbi:MAG: methyltransferase domain-containing protein, partial [Burkholderiaceae bacterium]|nr:methyltransferase domain-containing protein [Burkholderiaceae bacterium]